MAVVIGTGSFLLFFTFAVNSIALLLPYWIKSGNLSYGLWGSCKCTWYYSNIKDAIPGEDSSLAAWQQASQWLYAAAVFFIALALMMVFVASCCSDKAFATAMLVSGAFTLIGAVLVAVSIIVFGVMGNEKNGYSLEKEPRFDWAMWLGVAGFGIALITSIVLMVQGNRVRFAKSY